MANILSFRGREHRQTQLMLPWYATGTLDADECSAVEAHLSNCPTCREDLQTEREMASGVAGLTFDADAGWGNIRRQLQSGARPTRWQRAVEAIRFGLAWPGKFGWFVAGQALVAALVLSLAMPPFVNAEYHTLAASPDHAPGNVIVMFRPDTSEADFRAVLTASRAKIVDGPTVSGAYVLRVAADDRNTILTALRSSKSIILAQPIDAEAGR